MKRSEIIDLLSNTGSLMDAFVRVEIKDAKTEELAGIISADVIHGMQTAMNVCVRLLKGSHEHHNAVDLASDLIHLYACAVIGFNPDECNGTEFRAEASECPDFRRKEAGESEGTGEDDGARS